MPNTHTCTHTLKLTHSGAHTHTGVYSGGRELLCSPDGQRYGHVSSMVCSGLPWDRTGAYFTRGDMPGIPDSQGRWVEEEQRKGEREEGRGREGGKRLWAHRHL